MTPEELSERLLAFAVCTTRVADDLPGTRTGRHVAGQLVRCGTSPMPNYEEACGAESRRDFVHKLRTCLKELGETRVWLGFTVRAALVEEAAVADVLVEADQLCNILGSSVATVSEKRRPRPSVTN